jgi:hypothetical protein
MEQPRAEVSEEDLERLLLRDYGHGDLDRIRGWIRDVDMREKLRVVAACLKNAAGSVERLQGELQNASGYYREILSEAEYPNATRKWSRWEKLSEAEQQALIDQDARQYEDWFRRP